MDALFQNQLMNVDTLSGGQTYGAKLLELYSLTTGGTVAKFPGTTDIYYSYDEATKTLTLTYTAGQCADRECCDRQQDHQRWRLCAGKPR